MRAEGLDDVPVVVGGIIPPATTRRCCAPLASRRVYTPKDFQLNTIMADIVRIVGAGAKQAA